MAHDPKCYELAEYFLPGAATERLKSELAQHIQDSVEDWLNSEAAALSAEITKEVIVTTPPAALRPPPEYALAKLCPFCGCNESEYVTVFGSALHYVRCRTCEAATGPMETFEAALAAWNRRVPEKGSEP